MPSPSPLVTIITVNYNQLEYTLEFLASLALVTYPNLEVIVVDNGSKVNPESAIYEKFPKTTVISSEKNLGFAGGNNLGITKAKGKYLMFLNNDTEVEPGFLEPMVDFCEKNPDVGALSPKIKYFSSPEKNIIQWGGSDGIDQLTVRGKARGGQEVDQGQCDDIIKCELVHGAAMMIPFEVVLKVGLMADIYFLYYEEHDWIERIKQAGYSVYYVGTSTVYHKESMSVGKNSPLKTYYLNRGRIIFTRRNRRGLTKLFSLLFFCLVSFPKNIASLILKKEWKHLSAFWAACRWNLKSDLDIYKNPELKKSPTGEFVLINETLQTIKLF